MVISPAELLLGWQMSIHRAAEGDRNFVFDW
jgi:hypothetical protein